MLFRIFYLRILQARTFKNSSGVIFLCEYARDRVMSQIGDLSCETALIPHGVQSRFYRQSNPQRKLESFSIDDPFRLLYVSIVDVYKHQWNVVEAVSQLRCEGVPVTLDIVGPSYEPALRRLQTTIDKVDSTGDFVRYLGNISHEELHEVFASADGFVFASTCENFPNILLEAMASGLPIASSDCRPMTDILGDNSFVFDPVNIQSVFNSICQMVDDYSRRDTISQEVYSRASRYTWKNCTKATFKFIEEIATSK